jgi:hypothetical protein
MYLRKPIPVSRIVNKYARPRKCNKKFAHSLTFRREMFLDLQPILEDGLTAGQVGEEAVRAAHLILDRSNTLLQFVGMISSSAW